MSILSIIIPAYNVGKFLDKTVNSILSCNRVSDCEVFIVCNSGSRDNTETIAQSFQDSYPDIIRFLPKPNGGYGSVINYALPYVKGKYIRVLDGDDWINTSDLGDLIFLLEHTECDAIATNYYIYNEATESMMLQSYNNIEYNHVEKFDNVCDLVKSIEMHSIIFNSDFLRKYYEPLDENCFYVDVEYILYPIKNIETIMFSNLAIYVYRVGDVNQSVSINSKIKNRRMLEHVINNLINYFNLKSICNSREKYIARRIDELIYSLYSTYMRMEDTKTSKADFVVFDSSLKEISPLFYNRVQLRTKLVRLSGYKLYWVLSILVKLKNGDKIV